jgi:hypothetical protein
MKNGRFVLEGTLRLLKTQAKGRHRNPELEYLASWARLGNSRMNLLVTLNF